MNQEQMLPVLFLLSLNGRICSFFFFFVCYSIQRHECKHNGMNREFDYTICFCDETKLFDIHAWRKTFGFMSELILIDRGFVSILYYFYIITFSNGADKHHGTELLKCQQNLVTFFPERNGYVTFSPSQNIPFPLNRWETATHHQQQQKNDDRWTMVRKTQEKTPTIFNMMRLCVNMETPNKNNTEW